MENAMERVCLLIDVDSFDVQVYRKFYQIEEDGGLCVVANGKNRITAVSYEAKRLGLSRDKDQYVTPELLDRFGGKLNVLRIPERKETGKPDLTVARQATNAIISVIKGFCNEFSPEIRPKFEYSSRDEFYLDCTALAHLICSDSGRNVGLTSNKGENSLIWMKHNLWNKTIVETGGFGPIHGETWEPIAFENRGLQIGVFFASELIRRLLDQTGLQVSIGVGPNKLISKIACGHNKPAAVTAVPMSGLPLFSKKVKIEDIPRLGGKMGESIKQSLKWNAVTIDGILAQQQPQFMADLLHFSVEELATVPKSVFTCIPIGMKQAQEFYNLVRGKCDKPIIAKDGPNSISVSNNFYGKDEVFTLPKLYHQIHSLAKEMLHRVKEEKVVRHRRPVSIKCSIKAFGAQKQSKSLEYSETGKRSATEITIALLEKFGVNEATWTNMRISNLEMEGKPFRPIGA